MKRIQHIAYFKVPYKQKDKNNDNFCCGDKKSSKGDGVTDNEAPELNQFYYHSDHLGSSSYITNLKGSIVQHVEYVPFGEVFIEERNNKWNTPYLFNSKELDEETGFYYYGARYYNSRNSLWLSVDPLWEEHPDYSPYVYVLNNPIKFVDPTGMLEDDYFNKQGKYLGSDEAKTDRVKIVDQKDWDANKTLNSDGSESIAHVKGSTISTDHSKSNLTNEATLNVYDHYNPTGLKVAVHDNEKGEGGLTFAYTRKRQRIKIKIEGNKKKGIADHANEIINSFIHEEQHYNDFKKMGYDSYKAFFSERKEYRAIMKQMQHWSFPKTRKKNYQENVMKYGKKKGMIFKIKPIRL